MNQHVDPLAHLQGAVMETLPLIDDGAWTMTTRLRVRRVNGTAVYETTCRCGRDIWWHAHEAGGWWAHYTRHDHEARPDQQVDVGQGPRPDGKFSARPIPPLTPEEFGGEIHEGIPVTGIGRHAGEEEEHIVAIGHHDDERMLAAATSWWRGHYGYDPDPEFDQVDYVWALVEHFGDGRWSMAWTDLLGQASYRESTPGVLAVTVVTTGW